MTKKEFLNKLGRKLSKVSSQERNRICSYYSELIADKMDEGMTEQEAIDSLGDIDQIAEASILDIPLPSDKSSNNTWLIVLLAILSSPVWLPIVCALIGILIGLLVTVFSILCAIVVTEVAMLLAGLVLVVGGFIVAIRALPFGIFIIGCGLVLLGIAMLLVIPVFALSKLIVVETVNIFKRIFNRKERYDYGDE